MEGVLEKSFPCVDNRCGGFCTVQATHGSPVVKRTVGRVKRLTGDWLGLVHRHEFSGRKLAKRGLSEALSDMAGPKVAGSHGG
jgi:hypothetical protein